MRCLIYDIHEDVIQELFSCIDQMVYCDGVKVNRRVHPRVGPDSATLEG
jgi:hypothetical protein